MKSDLQKRLYTDFPTLFERKGLGVQQSCMSFGCECSDGWYGLIHELCSKLTALHPNIRASQVKEKYGRLCFYLGSEGLVPSELMDRAYDLEMEYEAKSASICEECSAVGKLYGSGWVKTLCPSHAESLGYVSTEE